MSFKYYVLTSGNIRTLERQFTTLKPNETVVVINSLNKEYVVTAADFCASNNIEYHITESDGTPATGKNSVLDKFLESDNEYMVQVDGDDIITPYGRNLYRTVALGDSPPDIICLADELYLEVFNDSLLKLFKKQVDSKRVKRDFMFIPRKYGSRHPWKLKPDNASFSLPTEEGLAKHYLKKCSDYLTEERAYQWAQTTRALAQMGADYNDRYNSLNRVVFYSRKGAEGARFDPILTIGEDRMHYYKLKKLSYEGNLDMRVRKEEPAYTYLYIADTHSTTRYKEEMDYDYQAGIVTELNKMEMYPKGYRLKNFEDPYYEVE